MFFWPRFTQRATASTPPAKQARRPRSLGNSFQPRLENYLAGIAGYQTNKYEKLSPELRAEITRRWGTVIRKYGYDTEPAPTTP